MIKIDPQQELFTRLKLDIEALGYAVFDGFLPPMDTPYPFVYLGDFRQTDTTNKSAVFGNVYGMIHVWIDSPQQRGTLSKMLLDIKTVCRKIEHTDNFSWMLTRANQDIRPDNSTNTPLLHGYIDAGFMFS